MEISKIGILGAGMMGGGIAHQAAKCGLEVLLCDVEQSSLAGAVDRAAALMDKQISKGKMTEEDKTAVLARMKTTADLADFAAVDFVIEAIVEDLAAKKKAFQALDRICRPDVIIATNTSSIAVTALAAATSRPGNVAGMHFFNPAQVMKLVEIVRGLGTSDETVDRISKLAEALDKTAIVLKKDTPGFVVNRLLFVQFLEAIRMYEEGIASKEDIDMGAKLGLGHPMGPFELMDFGSLDLAVHVTDYLYNETKDARWNAPHALRSHVRAGRNGRKSGRGWYEYEDKG
jgi:3-hydroxybutyryl-CoA dehydrogenase